MQEVSTDFTNNTRKSMRLINWNLLMSWLKDYEDEIVFFTIGESLIGGTDIIKGTGDIIQEWDKYSYDSYRDRVISLEYTREIDRTIGGAILAFGDITLKNHDDYFTIGSGSPIDGNILPYRPLKLFAGFNNEAIPVLIGLSDKMPVIDDRDKTVEIHCIDFLQEIFNTPLDETVILQDKRVDEIISDLLEVAGLVTTQFSLDVASTIVGFFYADKGDKLGDVLRKLCEADLGSIELDENGVIRYLNRTSWNGNSSVWAFDKSTILDIKVPNQDDIINVVEVRSDIRQVLANQKFWELAEPILIPAGGDVTIWADFTDPVTSCDEPLYITSATTSFYTTNQNSDGSGLSYNANIALDDASLFAKSYKMIFTNSASIPVYITSIELFSKPAKVVNSIYIREEDSDSVSKYGELPLTITNNFIQDESTATSIAKMLLEDNSEYANTLEITVKGVPQLEVGDVVTISTNNINNEEYFVKKITGKMNNSFIQNLTLIKKTFNQYFRVGISTIGGTDLIGP